MSQTVTESPAERLADIRESIVAENVSYGELAELQSLQSHIDRSDILLLEWAGVPEFTEGFCSLCDAAVTFEDCYGWTDGRDDDGFCCEGTDHRPHEVDA